MAASAATSRVRPLLALAVTWVHTLTYGDLLVGVGTLALAGITAYLGIETRATARAARQAVEGSEEPFVIATPTDQAALMQLRSHEKPQLQDGVLPPFEIHRAHEEDPHADQHFVRMKLWNIGLGPAIVENVILRSGDGFNYLDTLPQFFPLAVGSFVDIEIGSEMWPAGGGNQLMRIIYTHASGRRYETTSVAAIYSEIVMCKTYERSPLKSPGATTRLKYRLGLDTRPGLQRTNVGL